MYSRFLTRFILILAVVLMLFLAACSPAGAPRPVDNSGDDPVAGGATTEPTVALPTQVAEATVATPPNAEPTQLVESTIPPPPLPTVTETAVPLEEPTAAPSATAGAPTATAAPPNATRSASGVVVTSEPRVDVYTYGTGVVGEQIEGPLRASVAFLNSLIVDGTGNSSLPYLVSTLHGEALDAPSDEMVLGIVTGYVSYELSWLGPSAPGSQVQVVLSYESGGQSTHVLDLRRGGDGWLVSGVRAG